MESMLSGFFYTRGYAFTAGEGGAVMRGRGEIKFIRSLTFLVCPKTKTAFMQMLPAGSFN